MGVNFDDFTYISCLSWYFLRGGGGVIGYLTFFCFASMASFSVEFARLNFIIIFFCRACSTTMLYIK